MKTSCRSDVDILHRCILIFRHLFIESTDIDPFESCMTIAMACNLVYRSNFLLQNSIGIIPKHGYRGSDVHSVEAQKWMKFLEIQRGVKIRRSSSGGEERIGKYKIDESYYDVQGKKVLLEYAGCFWHGYSKCYSVDLENPQKHQTMGALEHLFLDKIRYLEGAGYKVEVIWSHEFKDLKNDPLYQQHEDEILKSTVSPLKPRDAFYGGRTNACKLFAKVVKAGNEICYYDVCSLYLWVMKYCRFLWVIMR